MVEFCLGACGGARDAVALCGREASKFPEEIIVTGGKGQGSAQLIFACDGSTSDIEKMLSQPDVISDLKELKAGIALALPDLSAERARIVQKLNGAKIAVTAWLALPAAQGYYLNAGNAPAAGVRFFEFEKWSATYGLRWSGVGLDIEPNIQEFAAIKGNGKWRLAGTLRSAPTAIRRSSTIMKRLRTT